MTTSRTVKSVTHNPHSVFVQIMGSSIFANPVPCPIGCKNENLQHGIISCPDSYEEECGVAHFGYGCNACRSVFTIEWEPQDFSSGGWMMYEEEPDMIIINSRALEKLKIGH